MDFLEEIGARRYLNAEDTFTKNGASRMSPAVYQAMQEASAWWGDLYEVQRETGRAIARMTRNEGAYITSGAACGLTLCAAAALCGEDWDAWHALPDASRLAKNEAVLLTPQLTPYACSVAASGARIVQAGAPGEYVSARVLEQAVTEKTAVIFYFLYHGACLSLPLEEALRVAKAKGVPLVVDAAAQLPPAENLWKYTRWCSAGAKPSPAPRIPAWYSAARSGSSALSGSARRRPAFAAAARPPGNPWPGCTPP